VRLQSGSEYFVWHYVRSSFFFRTFCVTASNGDGGRSEARWLPQTCLVENTTEYMCLSLSPSFPRPTTNDQPPSVEFNCCFRSSTEKRNKHPRPTKFHSSSSIPTTSLLALHPEAEHRYRLQYSLVDSSSVNTE